VRVVEEHHREAEDPVSRESLAILGRATLGW